MELTRPCPNGHTMTLQKIVLHFERGAFSADVHDVLAYVCAECGARLIPGATAEQVSVTVEALFSTVRPGDSPESPTPYSRLVFQRMPTQLAPAL